MSVREFYRKFLHPHPFLDKENLKVKENLFHMEQKRGILWEKRI